MGADVQHVPNWLEQVIAEDIDLFLEDFEDLAKRCHVEEEIDRSVENLAQRSLYDLAAKVPLLLFENELAELLQGDHKEHVEGSLVHVRRVHIFLSL